MTTTSVHPRAGASERGEPSQSIRPATPVLEHEYDGIREYDNPLPRWWVMLFWGSFVYSLGYLVHYHLTGNGPSVAQTYEEEMKLAREARAQESLAEAPSEQVLGALMGDRELMLDAKALFEQRCAACHAAEGQGLIGPNLTDDHWIHGDGSLMSVYRTVNDGVPTKGMPAWALQLKPIELRKVVAFVGTLRGRNASGKAPEGRALPRP